jgi:hypothetical protein
MWSKCIILGVVLIQSGSAFGQSLPPNFWVSVTNQPWGRNSTIRLKSQPRSPIFIITNASAGLTGRILLASRQALNPATNIPTAPQPGVYKTEPYSCLVVVPGPHPDDKCIVGAPGRGSEMPVIVPELRFIPYTPK